MATLKQLKESPRDVILQKLATMERLKTGGVTRKEKKEIEKNHEKLDKEIHDEYGKRDDE